MRCGLQLLLDPIYKLFFSLPACSSNGCLHTWSEMFLKILGKTIFFWSKNDQKLWKKFHQPLWIQRICPFGEGRGGDGIIVVRYTKPKSFFFKNQLASYLPQGLQSAKFVLWACKSYVWKITVLKWVLFFFSPEC